MLKRKNPKVVSIVIGRCLLFRILQQIILFLAPNSILHFCKLSIAGPPSLSKNNSHTNMAEPATGMTNIGYPLDEILSLDFNPSKLTKLQLRSVLLEYGSMDMDEFPPPSSKKGILVELFNERIAKRRSHIRAKSASMSSASNGRGIVIVHRDGSESIATGTPLKVRAGVAIIKANAHAVCVRNLSYLLTVCAEKCGI